MERRLGREVTRKSTDTYFLQSLILVLSIRSYELVPGVHLRQCVDARKLLVPFSLSDGSFCVALRLRPHS